MVEVRAVEPGDDEGLARWHGALLAGVTWERPTASVATLGAFRTSLASPSPSKQRLAVGAWEGGSCLGAMLVELPVQVDRGTAEVEIAVPAEHRRCGVGDALWRWALERTAAEGRGTLQVELAVPEGHTLETWPGAGFAADRGFASAHVEDHLVVDLPYDAGRLAELGAAAPTDGYRVRAWSGPCPAEHLEAWARLRTAMAADVPTGELSREAAVVTVDDVVTSQQRSERSYVLLHSLALDPTGDPVGYSTVLVPRDDPADVLQDDTLVLRAHRGHGLGQRLKIANLHGLAALPAELGSRCRRLHTWTAQGNAAMQAVNARFGFRRVEVLHELERTAEVALPDSRDDGFGASR